MHVVRTCCDVEALWKDGEPCSKFAYLLFCFTWPQKDCVLLRQSSGNSISFTLDLFSAGEGLL